MFAWLRPGDLVWNYWVNNYLLGRQPPAFDILFWNADTTRMTASCTPTSSTSALAMGWSARRGVNTLGMPVDLSQIRVDAYVVAGITDHITPWQNCYRSTQLLGGDTRFVLSTSGHIAALVNPPGNPKATFQTSKDTSADPQHGCGRPTPRRQLVAGLRGLARRALRRRRRAPHELGGGGLRPLAEAPGTYVYEN